MMFTFARTANCTQKGPAGNQTRDLPEIPLTTKPPCCPGIRDSGSLSLLLTYWRLAGIMSTLFTVLNICQVALNSKDSQRWQKLLFLAPLCFNPKFWANFKNWYQIRHRFLLLTSNSGLKNITKGKARRRKSLKSTACSLNEFWIHCPENPCSWTGTWGPD